MKNTAKPDQKPMAEPLAVPYSVAMAKLSVGETTLHRLIKAGVLVRKQIKRPGSRRPISRITIESIIRCLQDKSSIESSPEKASPIKPAKRPARLPMLTKSMKPVPHFA